MSIPESGEHIGRTGAPSRVPDHELLCQIGSGSYGEVWMARGITGSLRAVKIVHQQSFDSPRPYEREFQGISHFEPISRGDPGLVDILQVGRSPENTSFYYVMELADNAKGHSPSRLDGEMPTNGYEPLTLETLLRKEGGRLAVHRCVGVAMTLARGLAYLHKAGLVHRDIKPSNIIFVGGVPKLADVGLVARLEERKSFVGTEGFVPPEGPGTARADIYALGKCLYEAAMGRDRQEFPSPATHLQELPDWHDLLEFNEIITKACDPDPAQRYQDGGEMLKELELLSAGRSVRGFRARRSRLLHFAWISGVAMGLMTVAFGWRYFTLRPTDPRVSRQPAYRLMVREVQLPILDRALARFAQYDNDKEPELILTSSSGAVAIMSLDGHVPFSYDRSHQYPGLVFERFADIDGDGVDEWFGSFSQPDHFYGVVFNSAFGEIQRFEFPNPIIHAANGGERSAALSCFGVVPAQAGKAALAVHAWTHMSTNFPRHLIGSDWLTGAEVWRYSIPGSPQGLVFHDLDKDDSMDLIFGTHGADNGYVDDHGHSDSTVYLIAVRRDGTEMWCRPFAPEYCSTAVHVAGIAGQEQIYALASRDPAIRAATKWSEPGFARLARLSPTGEILASWQATNHLYDLGWAALQPHGATNLIAPDSEGCLEIFDPIHLNLLQSVPVTRPTGDCWVQLRLIGIEDLDEDGLSEIVLASQQFQFVSGENLGKPEMKPNIRRTLDNRMLILDHDLKKVASFLVSPLRKDRSELNAAIVENRLLKCREVAVIEDRGIFLRLKHLRQ